MVNFAPLLFPFPIPIHMIYSTHWIPTPVFLCLPYPLYRQAVVGGPEDEGKMSIVRQELIWQTRADRR